MAWSKKALDEAPIGITWDDKCAGLGLRVRSSSKMFVLKYRNDCGKQRWLTLGSYSVIGIDTARKMATKAKASILNGVDPAEEKANNRKSKTVNDLLDRFWDEHVLVHLKPTTIFTYRCLTKIVRKNLGDRTIKSITVEDAMTLHISRKHQPRHANQILCVLSKAFSLAEVWGLRPKGTNPCIGVTLFPETHRKRYLSPMEISKLMKALDEEESLIYEAKAFKLIMLTGARFSEIRKLRWDQVFLKEKALRFGVDDHKTGSTMGMKSIHLSDAAIAIFDDILHLGGSAYVFPSHNHKSYTGTMRTVWARAIERSGIPDIRPHDLRHTFASIIASSGGSLTMIGAALGHSNPATTQRYAHLFDTDLLIQANNVGNYIENAIKQA